jgi:2,5-furandicarboxylate decarboxylase 1
MRVQLPDRIDSRFRTALRRLDEAGRLVKVRKPVDPDLEMAGLMKRHDGDRAMLFESVTGHEVPVVGNLLCSAANCEAAFGLEATQIRRLVGRGLDAPEPPVVRPEGPAQEQVLTSGFDLGRFMPALTHTEGDGGRFITAGVVIAQDPETDVYNASYHRLQLVDANRTAIKLDYGRHLRTAYERAARLGQALPVAVCIGTDLSLMYTAATMGSRMGPDDDELAAAGGIIGEPLETIRCVTQDLLVPAETEIVLEGVISPTETVSEGPFAEFLGYYAPENQAPVLEVTAVTHRADPVYFAINGYGRETVMLRKYALEASLLTTLEAAVPIVTDVEMTPGGLHRFHAVVGVAKRSPQHEGLQRNAMLAAFGTLKDLDRVIVVDDDIDIADETDVEYALATRFDAARDLVVIPAARGHEYVRVSDRGVRSKLGIDATVPVEQRERFARARFADVELGDDDSQASRGSARLPWLHQETTAAR